MTQSGILRADVPLRSLQCFRRLLLQYQSWLPAQSFIFLDSSSYFHVKTG